MIYAPTWDESAERNEARTPNATRSYPTDRTTERPTSDAAPRLEYVHALHGRLRLRVPEIKRSPDIARRVESLLLGLTGIEGARANPNTGNVLVLFDPDQADQERIILTLHEGGYLRSTTKPTESTKEDRCPHCGAKYKMAALGVGGALLGSVSGIAASPTGRTVAKKVAGIVAKNLLEFALKRAVFALI